MAGTASEDGGTASTSPGRRRGPLGLLFQRGVPPHATFLFKHALVQDTAYSTLLRNQRQDLHARIARVLEERFSDKVATQPEILAQHYAQAGLVDIAIDNWHKAGERALRRSATLEAVQHLTNAIELTHSLPATPERNRRELDLHLALGRVVRIVKGIAAPETLRVFARARELLDYKNATVTQQMSVLYGLWGVHWVRAENNAWYSLHAPKRTERRQRLPTTSWATRSGQRAISSRHDTT